MELNGKKELNDEKKKKKKIIIIWGLVGLVIIIALVIGIILINKGKDKDIVEDEQDSSKIVLIDNLDVEINSERKLLSFIKENKDFKIISEDEIIDTSVLGEKELVIKYQDNEEEKEYKFKIKIVDTIAPVIEYNKEVNTFKGTKIDLLKDVVVTDNSKEEIKATVEGEYDFDKEGTYNLKYLAVDKSNNKTQEEFTLTVNVKEEDKTDNKSSEKTTSNKTSSSNSSSKTTNETSSKGSSTSTNNNNNNSNSNNSNSGNNSNSNSNSTSKTVVKTETREVPNSKSFEKYGVKYSVIDTYEVTTYSDGSTTEKYKSTRSSLDSSGYNGNTAMLLGEASELAKDTAASKYNEMLTILNGYRSEVGAPPLELDSNLNIAAMLRGLEMAYSGKFSHERPNMTGNTSCFSVLRDLNIEYMAVGENIAASYPTIKSTMEGWKNSQGHYENMIDPSFKKVGFGMVSLDGSKHKTYWVQIFVG